MRFSCAALIALLSAGTAPQAVRAQDQGNARPIVILGQRPLSGVPPERTLDDEDILSYGIGTVGELLDEVAAENGESADEPVILVNGEPVASLADIEEFPPEVVSQVEILPRGSGTRVGASADRRVYNVILKKQASTVVARTSFRTATDGGWTGGRGDLSYSNVEGSRRLNATGRIRREGALLESERDVEQPDGSPAGLGRFRTLQPSFDEYQLGLSAADRLAPWLTGGVTGKLTSGTRRSLLGIDLSGDPLRRRSRALAGNADLTLNATAGSWLISLLGTYNYDRRRTRTDQLTGLSRINSRAMSLDTDLTATGPVFTLPAGPARLTLGAGLARDSIRGSGSEGFTQWSKSVTGGVEVPIASASNEFLPALGELSASAQFTRTHVSHFGWFSNQTYSLSWQPAEWLRLFGSITTNRTPPAVGFLADPLIETPGVRYFDPLLDQTVDVTEISGGNPDLADLSAANRRLSANVKPFKSLPLQLTAEYTAIRNRDIVTALPPASDLIFAAFPERFVRDPGGTLILVDVRPVQFARESQKQLRTGLNLNLPLGNSRPSATPSATPDSGQGDEAQAAPARPARGGRPRLNFNLSHTLMLESELEIREGIDPIDLLSRDAIGLGGASRPRHQLDFNLGYSERGLGVRFSGRHRGQSFLRLVSNGDTDVLRFSPLTTFSLRAWAEPSRFAPNLAWLKGSRLSLSVLNLTDKRQRVTDSAGLTPLAYQKAYRDPLGRTLEIEFRKAF